MAKRKTSSRTDRSEVTKRVRKKIHKASELAQNQNVLIYGDSGVGKTRLAASAPKVLMLDVNDKGHDSVRRDIDPDYIQVEYWQEINDIYWYLQEGDHDYSSVAIDTISNLQNVCMDFVLGDEASRDASRDPDMPARQAWGKVGKLMRTQIINYRNLPLNVIFVAQLRAKQTGDDEDEESEIIYGPEVSPSVEKTLKAAVGTIGYLTKKEVIVKNKKKKTARREMRRRLLLGDSERYVSKDRNGVFPPHIDAPDLSEMLELIYGGSNG
jgi:phage nucleotide-binding protein